MHSILDFYIRSQAQKIVLTKFCLRWNLVCSTRNYCYFLKIVCNGFGGLPGGGFLLSCPLSFYNGLSSVSKRIHGFMGLWVERVQITLTRRTHDRSLLLYSMRRRARATSMKGIKVDPLPLFTVITQNICYAYS